jgi:hypothetical protein
MANKRIRVSQTPALVENLPGAGRVPPVKGNVYNPMGSDKPLLNVRQMFPSMYTPQLGLNVGMDRRPH